MRLKHPRMILKSRTSIPQIKCIILHNGHISTRSVLLELAKDGFQGAIITNAIIKR